MGRNRAIGAPYQTQSVVGDFTTDRAVDAYLVDAVPLVVTLDPFAVNNDQVLIQDVTDAAASNPIVIHASPGQTILNGYGATLSITENGGGVQFTFSGDRVGWVPQILSSRPGSGGGTTGATGAPGIGTTGATGVSGASGAGTTGATGVGTTGATGVGVPGATGAGTTGATGVGTTGASGAPGATGVGTTGATGAGTTGATGVGTTGATGVGTAGATGVGTTGATGVGTTGASGATGAVGATGAGTTGATGVGTTGATGVGTVGATGAPGATGVGTTGATGSQGATGAGSTPAGLMHFGVGSPNQNGFVQGKSASGLTVTADGAVSAGNLIVVLIQTESAIASIGSITVTDNLSTPTVYTAVPGASSIGNPGVNAIAFKGVPTVSGVPTISGNQGASFPRTSFAEFTNTGTTVDVANAGYAATSLSITTSNPLELVVGLVAAFHSAITFTAGAPLVSVVVGTGSDASFIEAGTATGAGAQSFSYSATATDNAPFFVVAFTPDGSFTPIGQDGDGYIDTASKKVYGPRTSGVYPLIGSLT
jgi:hypothetical protein